MSAFNTGSTLTSLHDAAILPYLKKELDKEDGNLFVVLHTYGSHFNYHERYPKEFRFYRPDKAEGIRASYKRSYGTLMIIPSTIQITCWGNRGYVGEDKCSGIHALLKRSWRGYLR